MTELSSVEIKGHVFPVKFRRNSRAKRITLRVCPRDRLIKVTLPPCTSLAKAEDFLYSHAEWIYGRLSADPSPERASGLTLMGQEFALHEDPLRRQSFVCHESKKIFLPPKKAEPALQKAVMQVAEAELPPLCHDHAATIGRQVQGVRLRDTKSRWGSCSSDGKIMLSWRLVLAPAEVARYVCIHEVCHLEHMNHSPAFWDLVEQLDPNYQQHRKWLRKHGNTLYRLV